MQNHIRPIAGVLAQYATRREAEKQHLARVLRQLRDDASGATPFGRRLALREPAFDRSNRKGA